MTEEKKEFGKRLAEIRKSKKLKQKELMEMIDAPTVQMISAWENGHSFPSPNYLIILSKKLDTSLDYLLLGKNEESKKRKIFTYKDVGEFMIEMLNCGLFKINECIISNNFNQINLETNDRTIVKFKHELDNLLIASKTLRKELFLQAINDLLTDYDFLIKKQ